MSCGAASKRCSTRSMPPTNGDQLAVDARHDRLLVVGADQGAGVVEQHPAGERRRAVGVRPETRAAVVACIGRGAETAEERAGHRRRPDPGGELDADVDAVRRHARQPRRRAGRSPASPAERPCRSSARIEFQPDDRDGVAGPGGREQLRQRGQVGGAVEQRRPLAVLDECRALVGGRREVPRARDRSCSRVRPVRSTVPDPAPGPPITLGDASDVSGAGGADRPAQLQGRGQHLAPRALAVVDGPDRALDDRAHQQRRSASGSSTSAGSAAATAGGRRSRAPRRRPVCAGRASRAAAYTP